MANNLIGNQGSPSSSENTLLQTASIQFVNKKPLNYSTHPIQQPHLKNLFLSLNTEITDPNFNKMRNNDTSKAKAITIVVGLLLVATVIPLGTWWFFSR